jgi:hypothetical protein
LSKRNPEKTAALAREHLTRIRHALAEIDTLCSGTLLKLLAAVEIRKNLAGDSGGTGMLKS